MASSRKPRTISVNDGHIEMLVGTIRELSASNQQLADSSREQYSALSAVVEQNSKETRDAIVNLTKEMRDVTESINTLTAQNAHIEDKALGQIETLKEDVSHLKIEVKDIKENQIRSQAINGFWSKHWKGIFGVMVVLTPVVAGLFVLLQKTQVTG